MKKRYQILLYLLTLQMTVSSSGINIPRLQEEFNRVGLYNPLSPGYVLTLFLGLVRSFS